MWCDGCQLWALVFVLPIDRGCSLIIDSGHTTFSMQFVICLGLEFDGQCCCATRVAAVWGSGRARETRLIEPMGPKNLLVDS